MPRKFSLGTIRTILKPGSERPQVVSPPVQQAGNSLAVFELDARQRVWAAERDAYLRQEEEQRLLNERLHNDALRQAKEQSIRDAAQRQRTEADKRILERKRNASAESVRRLRELIREKYRLDIFVWKERDALEADRDIIMAEYAKADRILQEIYFIVNAWDEDLFDAEEWKVAKKIRESLEKTDQHAIWGDIPPWDRPETGETTGRQS